MKFSHSIQFNAVPDWSSHYISYSNLKKLIYQLEKQIHSQSDVKRSQSDPESSPLLANGNLDEPDKIFTRKLDDELDKICSFYRLKELEIYGEVDALLKDVEEFEAEHEAGEIDGEGGGVRRQSVWARARQQSIFRSFQFPSRRRRTSTMSSREATIPEEDDSDGEEDEHSALTKSQTLDRRPTTRGKDFATGEQIGANDDLQTSQELLRRRPSVAFNDFGDDALQALYDEGITLKKRVINLYVNICELRSFIQLNETGFSKVLKKYDKILDRNLKSEYVKSKVKPAYPFKPETMDHLSENLSRVESAYASIVTKGDTEAARQELRLHLREHVVWERNTVWREMIGIERKAQAANLGIRNTMLGQDTDPKKARLQGDHDDGAMKEVRTVLGTARCPQFLMTGTFWVLIACIAIFAVLLSVPIMEKREQQNCLALVAFVSLLWATEV
jgi:phosphate transporter